MLSVFSPGSQKGLPRCLYFDYLHTYFEVRPAIMPYQVVNSGSPSKIAAQRAERARRTAKGGRAEGREGDHERDGRSRLIH